MYNRLKRFLKLVLSYFFYYTGLYLLISRDNEQLTILMYHSLSAGRRDRKDPLYRLQCSSGNFEKQMEYIRKYYNVISLDRGVECLYGGGELPKNSIVVTFDDGFKDNYAVGLPILKKYDIPATIFLTTSLIDGTAPYRQQKLKMAIEQTNPQSIKRAVLGIKDRFGHDRMGELLKAIGDGDREGFAARLFSFIEKMETEDAREELTNMLLNELCPAATFRLPNVLMMSWNDAREMLSYGISFGSHTMTHPILSNIQLEFAEREIRLSKTEIEKRLNVEVKHFAYPNGLDTDFAEEHKGVLRRSGYRSAVAVCWGYNNPGSDRYSMKRIPIGDYTLPKFVMQIKGVDYRSRNRRAAADKTCRRIIL